MSYGVDTYGQNPYGGSGFGAGPSLKSSVPASNETEVNRSGSLILVLTSENGIDTNTLSVVINGTPAIVAGIFQAGFAGTIDLDVEDCTVTISTHPLFLTGMNATAIQAVDNSGFAIPDLVGLIGGEDGILGELLGGGAQGWLLEFYGDTFTIAVAETVALSEAMIVSKAFDVAIAEALSVLDPAGTGQSFTVPLSESVTVFDAAGTGQDFTLSVPDLVPLLETATVVRGVAIDAIEDLPVTDGAVPLVGVVIDKAETVIISEVAEISKSFWTPVSEFVSISDWTDVVKGYVTDISESVSVSDAVALHFDIDLRLAETPVFIEGFTVSQPFSTLLTENLFVSDALLESNDVNLRESVRLLESVAVGMDVQASGYTVTVRYLPGLLLDGISNLGNYQFVPEDGAYPMSPESVTYITSPVAAGGGGSCQEVTSSPYTKRFGISTQLTPDNYGDYLRFTTARNGSVMARIVSVLEYTVDVDQYLLVDDPENGEIAWEVVRVDGVLLRTTKPTNGGLYWLHIDGLLKRNRTPFSGTSEFTGASYQPALVTVEPLDDGQIILTFSEDMRFDASLTDPSQYTIIGPGNAKVTEARILSPTQLVLLTVGLQGANYGLDVNAIGTPKDSAGNPIDPTFNQVVFTSTEPLTLRSVYTDKGPIAKPSLTLQNGTGALVVSFTEVTLPGASLTPSVVGKYLILGGATNGGTYRITGVVTTTRARVQASFTYPDPGSGTLTWEVFDPRDGQIADDPADVTVTVNSLPITPQAVIGLLGQIVLNARPDPTDDVKVGYSWVCNPEVEVRRLNSKEFRLNNWNRDIGRPHDASMHKYRFNNVLTTPALYVPDDPQAWLPQPEQRDLKYRAYERAYSALLNDPNLLLLNSPTQKIAFPPLSRSIASTFVSYDALVLPEADATPWIRKGTGLASVSGGELRVQDISGGPFPTGEPVFWVRPIDITFPCVFASTWRMRITADPVTEGVFTGVATGYSGGSKVLLLGYLDDGGTKKLGFLKKGCGNDLQPVTAWTGGIDSLGSSTGAPINWDWSVEHSYRIYKNSLGVTKLYVDGGVVEVLRVTEDELPYLEEVGAPFTELEGTFFGSLSRPAMNTSYWTFIRYTVLPTNPYQSAPSEFVSYEGTTEPEAASQPWTPIGYHGTETIIGGDFLLLDSTSATDAATESLVGLIEGDFKGFVRLEPLLSAAAEIVLDVNTQLRTFTHGICPNAVTAAIDDGDRLIQLSFFPGTSSPKFSYGGRSYPDDWTPVPWTSTGTATVEMIGRTLRITDTSITDGRVYFVDDTAALADPNRVVGAAIDYALEFRVRVHSYIADPGGFCGATADIYDSNRTLGLLLEEIGGVRSVSLHSDGVTLGAPGRYVFDWDDGEFHTYRITKRAAVPNPLVSLFIDGVYALSVDYTLFAVPLASLTGVISFGSSTATSSLARSVVDWAYCNCWRMQTSFRTYAGIWKGYDPNSLTGYHLPTKVTGRDAAIGGNALNDPLADFTAALVLPGDALVVDVGANKGTYEIASIAGPQTITIVGVFPSVPSTVTYRIVKEIDWTTAHKYRLVKDPGGGVSLFLDADTAPLIHLGYNNLDLPSNSVGLFKGIAGGLPSISFGAFDPTNLSQSSWDYVRFGITRSVSELRIVPHHEILNQRNVMASPEHLFTMIPHGHTDYWASSTGIPSQVDPDFLKNPGLVAFTLLNEGTPLVPLTQTAETRAGHDLIHIQEPLSGLNRPEDVLNSQDFTLNDATTMWRLNIPDDVLYNSLAVIEAKTGDTDIITPFCDGCGPTFGPIYYQNEVCLWYEGDVLPELDPTAQTPWVFEADDDTHVSRSAFAGVLTYGTDATGTKTIYRNATPLPDSAGLETEARFRLKLLNDGSFGLGDTQVRFGLSAPGLTVGIAFVTTPLGERYVLVRDLQAGIVVGGTPFDFGDGNFHTYRIVKDIATASVRIYIDS